MIRSILTFVIPRSRSVCVPDRVLPVLDSLSRLHEFNLVVQEGKLGGAPRKVRLLGRGGLRL